MNSQNPCVGSIKPKTAGERVGYALLTISLPLEKEIPALQLQQRLLGLHIRPRRLCDRITGLVTMVWRP
jgi:hypothetical protein